MKLKPLPKVILAFLLFGGLFGGLTYAKSHGMLGQPSVADNTASNTVATSDTVVVPPTAPRASGSKRIVVGVNDFGGAYPGVVSNDGAMPGPNSRFTAAGLDVEIRLIRGSKERLQAFESNDVDIMLLSLDYFANLVPVYKDKGVNIQAFLMADWSRGNLGIVTKSGIKSIEGLKSAKIVTTRNTPTHYFLINLLSRSNLSAADIDTVKSNLVFATKTPQAGEMFQRGEVDAVAIWEPHLSQAASVGKGRVLVSTATATNLIADVLFARTEFLSARQTDMQKFVGAWFEGVKMCETNSSAAVSTIAKAFKQTDDETRGVLAKIKPTTFADNRVFFGMDKEDAPYVTLFNDASRVWLKEGVIKSVGSALASRDMKALESQSREHATEQVVEKFAFTGGPKTESTPLLTKSVSVYFPTSVDRLDPNAQRLVDTFAEVVSQFGNSYVRVEGNTDNEGSRDSNVGLSKRRADALVTYLVAKHGFDRKRFVSVGNGPDKPVADNGSVSGREQNRRTDFQIIPNL